MGMKLGGKSLVRGGGGKGSLSEREGGDLIGHFSGGGGCARKGGGSWDECRAAEKETFKHIHTKKEFSACEESKTAHRGSRWRGL